MHGFFISDFSLLFVFFKAFKMASPFWNFDFGFICINQNLRTNNI